MLMIMWRKWKNYTLQNSGAGIVSNTGVMENRMELYQKIQNAACIQQLLVHCTASALGVFPWRMRQDIPS